MRFSVRYPQVDPGGRVSWRTKRTVIQRYLDQLEFRGVLGATYGPLSLVVWLFTQ